jgi:hypothetical protein
VAIAPGKLQRIPSDRLHILQHDQKRHIIRLQPPRTGPLIDTGCAGTLLAEIPDRINGLVPIVPFDAQHTLLKPDHVFRLTQGFCHLQEFPSYDVTNQLFRLKAEVFRASAFPDSAFEPSLLAPLAFPANLACDFL